MRRSLTRGEAARVHAQGDEIVFDVHHHHLVRLL